MDITNLFKACVKTIRTRNKALGLQVTDTTTYILNSRKSSEFALKAKEICGNIGKLQKFLTEHKKDYININHLSNESSGLTEVDRDHIDMEAQAFMKSCLHILNEFKNNVYKQNCPEQQRKHRKAVLELLNSNLRRVCDDYSQQRAIRVKRMVDKRKLLLLQTDSKPSKFTLNNSTLSEENSFQISEDDAPSPEEMQIFEQENERLYDELGTLADEVRLIEGKVVEISRLQEVFASKVLEQEVDVNRIQATTVGATENIKDANELIRDAMRKNASFRAWILFFLIVMAFSLLFLDWYNP